MKRLTPQEFYEQWRLEDTNSPQRFSFDSQDGSYAVWPDFVVKLMQAYAEHLEETAWVKDGGLPPKEDEVSSIVVELLVTIEPKICGDKKLIRTGYYDFGESRWFMTFADESIYFETFAWRPLPTLPKQ